MMIFQSDGLVAAQNHRPQIECFILSDGRRVVIERPEDCVSQDLPAEVLQIIAARNAPPDPVVPDSVSMAQARLALLQFRLPGGQAALAAASAAIAAMPGIEGDAARIKWEFASEVRRDDQLVAGMAAALGLTSEQLDQLFITAATL